MKTFVGITAFIAGILAVLLWHGSDAVVRIRSPFRQTRSTYYYPTPVELESSPVYYPQDRPVYRRAAQMELLSPLFNIMGENKAAEPGLPPTTSVPDSGITPADSTTSPVISPTPTTSSSTLTTTTTTSVVTTTTVA